MRHVRNDKRGKDSIGLSRHESSGNEAVEGEQRNTHEKKQRKLNQNEYTARE